MIHSFYNWGLIFLYVVFNSAGALLIKNQINALGPVRLVSFSSTLFYFGKLLSSWQVVGGFAAIFISALAWMTALSRMELSIAYPIAVGLNFLLIVGLSFLFFSEPLTFYKVLGVFLLLAGLFCITRA